MDADHFDQFARSLSDPSSRRNVLGLALGGVLGALGLGDAEAKKRKKKKKKKRPAPAAPLAPITPSAPTPCVPESSAQTLRGALRHLGQQLRPGGDVSSVPQRSRLPRQRQLCQELWRVSHRLRGWERLRLRCAP